MLLASGPLRVLGGFPSRLTFTEGPRAAMWAGRRLLLLDDKPAFELSFWCGTCAFLFERLDGANETMSIKALERRLTDGVDDVDDRVIAEFATLVPRGDYLPMLQTVQPRLTYPAGPDDYFAHEQVRTWGISPFWGLPEHPRTPYYRTFETPVDQNAHLFEFVVPMVPPTWNDADRVAEYSEALRNSSGPTAVAVATLDVCQPAMAERDADCHAHWCLTHFLLDGHHKMQAAAESGRPLRLLSLLSVDASLGTVDQVLRIPELACQAPVRRRG